MSTNNIVYRSRSVPEEQVTVTEEEIRLPRRWGIIIIVTLLSVILIMALVLFLSSPQRAGKQARDPVVATIGPTTTIGLSSFLHLFRNLYSRDWDMLTHEERTKLAESLVKRMIEHEILMELARELHLGNNETIEQSVKQFIGTSSGSMRDRSLYSSDRRTLTDWQRQIHENLIAMKAKDFIINRQKYPITDEMITRYYNEHQSEFTRDKSSALIKQLVFDDQRFGKTSLKTLQQRNRTMEEELDYLTRTTDSPPELIDPGSIDLDELDHEEASLIEQTPENSYFGYLQSNDEYVIYLVLAKNMRGQIPLEKVKNEIEAALLREIQAKVYETWVQQQYEKLQVKINLTPVLASLTNEAMLFQPRQRDSEEMEED